MFPWYKTNRGFNDHFSTYLDYFMELDKNDLSLGKICEEKIVYLDKTRPCGILNGVGYKEKVINY